MAYSSGFTAVTGATFLASQYNTYVRDNFSALWVFTTAGDIIYATSSTTAARLGIGASNEIFKSTGSAPAWSTLAALLQLTGLHASQAVGDYLYALTATTLGRLAKPSAGIGFLVETTAGVPSWVSSAAPYTIARNDSTGLAGEIFLLANTSHVYLLADVASTVIADTDVSFTAENEDGNWHSLVTNTNRVTPAVSGRYLTRGQLAITNASGTNIDSITAFIKKSTGDIMGAATIINFVTGATIYINVNGHVDDLTAGQYYTFSTSRSNVTAGVTIKQDNTWLNVERIR